MSDQPGPQQSPEPSEEELRAALEQQVKQLRVEQIVVENVVTLLNLGMRRTGLGEGTEDERDPGQVRLAIDAVRALLPLLEQGAPQHLRQIRDALSQLQLAYVRIGGDREGAPADAAAERPAEPGADQQTASQPPGPQPGEPGPAQQSGRLWVPGQ